MAEQRQSIASPPEDFVVEVFSEISREVVQRRWCAVNVVLRLSMLSALDMQLDATLQMLCDFAGEVAPYDAAAAYFWEDNADQSPLRVSRGLEAIMNDAPNSEANTQLSNGANIFNFWAARFARPLLVQQGRNPQADTFLDQLGFRSALVVPLMVNNHVRGTLHLYSRGPNAYAGDDAQLLWIMALVAESLLTREYANEGLIRFAFTDYLTGLKTRGYFEQQLELEIKRSERKQEQFALLMVDIDHFKALNDHYGHHVGDQVLRDVAALLMKDMREVDTVARYGGEEFVLILPETDRPGALQVAHRLRSAVAQSKFFAGSPQDVERLTISVGISLFDQDGKLKRELIEAADAALYAAKGSGRNRVVLYSELNSGPQRQVS
jgi:diguanylate cyclase (GGDEF)-like protein